MIELVVLAGVLSFVAGVLAGHSANKPWRDLARRLAAPRKNPW